MIKDPKKIRMILKKHSLNKEELSSVKEFLEYCSNIYYNTEDKYISDGDYDNFYDRYLELGGKPFMGAEPPENSNKTEVNHNYQELVGTTLKARNLEEFEEWLKMIYKNLNLNKRDSLDLVITLKFDGNSIVIEYDKNGKVLKALTRGKNGKGIDKTNIFKNKSINNPFKVPMAIKYECLILYSTLPDLNKARNYDYKNPRSACGKLNADDAKDFKEFFTLEPLWMKLNIDSNTNLNKYFKKIKDNLDLGYSFRSLELNYFNSLYGDISDTTNELYCISGNFKEILDDMKEVYEEVIDCRQDYDFMIDGIVVDVVDDSYRKKLGFIDGGENLKPRWCVAVKFPYMEEESEVTKIEFTMGDSGRISPVCYFKPVKFNGGTHTKQYLQGYKRFNELKLCKGTRIRISYHNDCLSYVERLDSIQDDKRLGRKPIPFIKTCPVCGEDLKIVTDSNGIGTSAYCINDECDGTIVGKINNFFKKMDIKGIEVNTIRKLYEAGYWTNIKDLFTFKFEECYDIEGLGKTSINKMVKSIEKKKYYDYEIVASVGIRGIGLDKAKDLCNSMELKHWMKWIEVKEKNEVINAIESIEGFSSILAKRIYNGLIDKREIIQFLMDRGYTPIQAENSFDKVRYSFVITGDLESCSRDKMKKILESHGHKLIGSVSNKTDYLVTNTPNSGTVKNKRAKELNKPIITEKKLIELLNLNMKEELKKFSMK